jgi:hypothetical protein
MSHLHLTAAQQAEEQQQDRVLAGQMACVFVRRRNYPLIRSSAFVVRSAFYLLLES